MRALFAALACLGAVSLGAGAAAAEDFSAGAITAPVVSFPSGTAKATVLLISDEAGWGETEAGVAADLTAAGAIVVGVDLPSWRKGLAPEPRQCLYLVADLETISHAVQRKAQLDSYLPPIAAGIGAGAAQLLAMAAQTPKATIGRTVVVDPTDSVDLAKPLCTDATATTEADGETQYGLDPGPLPDPIEVGLTPAAPADGAAHVKALQAEHPEVSIGQVDGPAPAALTTRVSAAIEAAAGADGDAPLGLPLTLLPATPTRDTMAIVFSGDGGWRDIDQKVGGVLQGMGIPVVGFDSLRYFWSEKTAAGTAADLDRLIRLQAPAWGVSKVLLVGYSFGADLLPATYNALPDDTRAQIPMVCLLALTSASSWQISVLGWFGENTGTGGNPADDIAKMNPAIVQCVYGTEEEDSPCPGLAAKGVEVIRTDGGHHFDGDYEALAHKIAAGLDRRLSGGAAPEPIAAPAADPASDAEAANSEADEEAATAP